MRLLAFDTAAGACSAAVWGGGAVVARRYQRRARGHAEALMPMIEAVLAEADLDYADLDALAVTRGPGTFTGLRIGLAAARGLALATGLPLAGLGTLEVIAAGVPDSFRGRPVLAGIEARRGELYVQVFGNDGRPAGPPQALALEAAVALATDRPVVVAGNAAARLAGALGADALLAPGDGEPDAAVLARLAAALPLPAAGTVVSPLYLRPPDARRRDEAAAP